MVVADRHLHPFEPTLLHPGMKSFQNLHAPAFRNRDFFIQAIFIRNLYESIFRGRLRNLSLTGC
jgi:hypothetical protein